jgi:hypothetical protein
LMPWVVHSFDSWSVTLWIKSSCRRFHW